MAVPVQPIQPAAIDWIAAAAGTLARPWKVGSTVAGRVTEYLPGGRLVLEISGLTVEADPPSGELMPRQFQARVLGTTPQPVLEVLGKTPQQGTPVDAALRARVPHQGGLQPVLADLRALAATAGTRALPESVRMALARLEASITDHQDVLDPAVLRDTLQRAGLQLEHKLGVHARSPARMPAAQIDYDLKAGLQRLAQALQQLPQQPQPAPTRPGSRPAAPPLLQLPLQPQPRLPPAVSSISATALAGGMLEHVEAALSRIEIMQLQAHPAASPQACMVEVPVRGEDGYDVLQVRIERDAEDAQDTGEPHWTLGFTLEPPSLGAIHGRIRLRGRCVDVDLWAQREPAVQALEEQTAVLARLLEASALELARLRVRQGTPLRQTGLGRTLLEARA